jgi:hypothetical protein
MRDLAEPSIGLRRLAWLVAAVLVACSSPMPAPVRLPPLPVPPAVRVEAPAPGASAPQAAAPASAPASGVAQPAPLEVLPYSAAVAARFPDPAVRYTTPAFQEQHAGFTTNAELQAFMRSLMRDPLAGGMSGAALLSLGVSQQGVPIEALLFSRDSDVSPAGLKRSGRPTVLLVGQQHGDEPAGAEALLVVAQSLAQGPLQALLDRINVIVLPRANPDGARAGRRATASGVDVNRDHLLLRTPEAQAQARLIRLYEPTVIVDAHEYTVLGRYLAKFGGVQRFDALVQYAMTANVPEFITKAAEEWFRQPLLASLDAAGLTSEWYYTTSADLSDRKVSMGGTNADVARNVNGLKNAVSILIETRGIGIGRLHLARRVHTHVTAITSVLSSTAGRAADLGKLRGFVESEVASLACQGEVVVQAAATPTEYTLLMLDPVSGADKPVPVAWDSSLALRTVLARPRPCGYWLGPEQVDALRRLRDLGVQVQHVEETGVVRGELYRELSREVVPRQDVRGPATTDAVLKVQAETLPALLDVPAGSWYVPLDQPLANLAVAALEPDTQSSFFSNGIVTELGRQARVLARPRMRVSAVP